MAEPARGEEEYSLPSTAVEIVNCTRMPHRGSVYRTSRPTLLQIAENRQTIQRVYESPSHSGNPSIYQLNFSTRSWGRRVFAPFPHRDFQLYTARSFGFLRICSCFHPHELCDATRRMVNILHVDGLRHVLHQEQSVIPRFAMLCCRHPYQ
ncbi:hypothetical protein BJ508DRAFT_81424 [Ascobolus immersus RN42]|uniref:Uncharacterized protein n=1 Tax=Ascobolus immersus RN42 TaxID=1160509 RepID=A0A3N4IBS0_ASCIM|nr:hypothetical protein BJ508DRAFT_81424 [Ascobolus immersus RN42]